MYAICTDREKEQESAKSALCATAWLLVWGKTHDPSKTLGKNLFKKRKGKGGRELLLAVTPLFNNCNKKE